jgi:hypothetical protein
MNVTDIKIHDFKIYCSTIETNTACYCHKKRMGTNGEEDSEIILNSYIHLIPVKKSAKNCGETV